MEKALTQPSFMEKSRWEEFIDSSVLENVSFSCLMCFAILTLNLILKIHSNITLVLCHFVNLHLKMWLIFWHVYKKENEIKKTKNKNDFTYLSLFWGFTGGSDSKESPCNAGDSGSICGSERSPGEGNGNPLQYSCLENSMDIGTWWATVHGFIKNQTQLSN